MSQEGCTMWISHEMPLFSLYTVRNILLGIYPTRCGRQMISQAHHRASRHSCRLIVLSPNACDWPMAPVPPPPPPWRSTERTLWDEVPPLTTDWWIRTGPHNRKNFKPISSEWQWWQPSCRLAFESAASFVLKCATRRTAGSQREPAFYF